MNSSIIKIFSIANFALVFYRNNENKLITTHRYGLGDVFTLPKKDITYSDNYYKTYIKYGDPTGTLGGSDYVTPFSLTQNETIYMEETSLQIPSELEFYSYYKGFSVTANKILYFQNTSYGGYNINVNCSNYNNKTTYMEITITNLGSYYSTFTLYPEIKVYENSSLTSYLFTIKPTIRVIYTGSGTGD